MQSHTVAEIRRVFSILPKAEAEAAVDATVKRMRSDSAFSDPQLTWAEFTARGRFLRGGVSSLSDYVTQLATHAEDDPVIAAMAKEAADGSAEPGRIIRIGRDDGFAWFLPVLATTPSDVPQPRVKGFYVNARVFDAIMTHFNSGSGLTEAERRVAFQLVAGLPLRAAAELDGVGVETKRTQLKSATAKMQCSGQVDLVRTLIGQLTHVLAVSDSEVAHTRVAEDFVAAHFGNECTLTVERLPNGHIVRCVEVGPADGRPVVVVHGMMVGVLIANAREALAAAGIRLLIPLRRGYLDARPVLGLRAQSNLISTSGDDLAAFIRQRDLAPVTLLGHSLGALPALAFAARHREQVERMVLLSANLAQRSRQAANVADDVYYAFQNLAERERLGRALALEFGRHYADPATLRATLQRLYGGSPSDIATLDGGERHAAFYGWFAELYRSSVAGVSEDYNYAMHNEAGALPQLPLLVVHGRDDPFTSADEMRRFAAEFEATMALIDGAGHFAPVADPATVWQAVAGFLD